MPKIDFFFKLLFLVFTEICPSYDWISPKNLRIIQLDFTESAPRPFSHRVVMSVCVSVFRSVAPRPCHNNVAKTIFTSKQRFGILAVKMPYAKIIVNVPKSEEE